jgi:hypothetical protein
VQTTGLLPVQVPPTHVSVWVQAFPSLHVVPFAAFGVEQVPDAGLQAPAVWHAAGAGHTTGLDPTQVPVALHASVCVQASLSSQLVPFAAVGFEHAPVAGLQVPAV